MIAELGATQQGCLLFADITGYTRYINETEITHAQDVVADLIETMVEVITPTFELSRIEGDAAFAFAPSGSVTAEILMDTVDQTYFSFRRRLRDVAHATSCPCQACVKIPELDLKFFLHEGEYAVRKVAGFTELSGMDVIVLHRLAKGTANSVAGGNAYAVYTRAIIDVMGFDPADLRLVAHTEEFADTGPIEVFVQDLEARWLAVETASSTEVQAEDAIYQAQFKTAAPTQVVWDHLTDPTKRLAWQTHVTEVLPMTEGRQQAGSVNHCMHGEDVTIEQIATWRPFSLLTLRYDLAGVKDWLWTYRLDSIGEGTRFTVLAADPGASHWERVGTQITDTLDLIIPQLENAVEEAWAARAEKPLA